MPPPAHCLPATCLHCLPPCHTPPSPPAITLPAYCLPGHIPACHTAAARLHLRLLVPHLPHRHCTPLPHLPTARTAWIPAACACLPLLRSRTAPALACCTPPPPPPACWFCCLLPHAATCLHCHTCCCRTRIPPLYHASPYAALLPHLPRPCRTRRLCLLPAYTPAWVLPPPPPAAALAALPAAYLHCIRTHRLPPVRAAFHTTPLPATGYHQGLLPATTPHLPHTCIPLGSLHATTLPHTCCLPPATPATATHHCLRLPPFWFTAAGYCCLLPAAPATACLPAVHCDLPYTAGSAPPACPPRHSAAVVAGPPHLPVPACCLHTCRTLHCCLPAYTAAATACRCLLPATLPPACHTPPPHRHLPATTPPPGRTALPPPAFPPPQYLPPCCHLPGTCLPGTHSPACLPACLPLPLLPACLPEHTTCTALTPHLLPPGCTPCLHACGTFATRIHTTALLPATPAPPPCTAPCTTCTACLRSLPAALPACRTACHLFCLRRACRALHHIAPHHALPAPPPRWHWMLHACLPAASMHLAYYLPLPCLGAPNVPRPTAPAACLPAAGSCTAPHAATAAPACRAPPLSACRPPVTTRIFCTCLLRLPFSTIPRHLPACLRACTTSFTQSTTCHLDTTIQDYYLPQRLGSHPAVLPPHPCLRCLPATCHYLQTPCLLLHCTGLLQPAPTHAPHLLPRTMPLPCLPADHLVCHACYAGSPHYHSGLPPPPVARYTCTCHHLVAACLLPACCHTFACLHPTCLPLDHPTLPVRGSALPAYACFSAWHTAKYLPLVLPLYASACSALNHTPACYLLPAPPTCLPPQLTPARTLPAHLPVPAYCLPCSRMPPATAAVPPQPACPGRLHMPHPAPALPACLLRATTCAWTPAMPPTALAYLPPACLPAMILPPYRTPYTARALHAYCTRHLLLLPAPAACHRAFRHPPAAAFPCCAAPARLPAGTCTTIAPFTTTCCLTCHAPAVPPAYHLPPPPPTILPAYKPAHHSYPHCLPPHCHTLHCCRLPAAPLHCYPHTCCPLLGYTTPFRIASPPAGRFPVLPASTAFLCMPACLPATLDPALPAACHCLKIPAHACYPATMPTTATAAVTPRAHLPHAPPPVGGYCLPGLYRAPLRHNCLCTLLPHQCTPVCRIPLPALHLPACLDSAPAPPPTPCRATACRLPPAGATGPPAHCMPPACRTPLPATIAADLPLPTDSLPPALLRTHCLPPRC